MNLNKISEMDFIPCANAFNTYSDSTNSINSAQEFILQVEDVGLDYFYNLNMSEDMEENEEEWDIEYDDGDDD